MVKKIRRGDDLVLRCAYDTSGKTTPTSFGDFTQTEMCWSAFIYYPAQHMSQAVIQGSAGERRLTWCNNYGTVTSYVPRPMTPQCEWKGFLYSEAAYQVLSDMGVNTTGWTTRTSTTTTATATSGTGSGGDDGGNGGSSSDAHKLGISIPDLTGWDQDLSASLEGKMPLPYQCLPVHSCWHWGCFRLHEVAQHRQLHLFMLTAFSK
ncbi:hypothetical protein AK812_SmicGene11537 [Symbiodinium microadriaticum]|uniref:Copper type II ascorbate-dependent monooxygenase C-terminal domain-containing protein n=1 Tax=Symbiodinium microadriaticum TaxID=2951 RepID=A0A1Q9ECY9_SYMMI|nr:hypothetical protein AK812_SmicGene11537 [Symbiodinium microadriaticum]